MIANQLITIFSVKGTLEYEVTHSCKAFVDNVKNANIKSSGVTTGDSAFIMFKSRKLPLYANGKNFIALGEFTSSITGATATELSNNLKLFKEQNETLLMTNIDYKFAGSNSMHHYEIGAK